jgi:beta-barrel assembly-enhancing protease
MIRPGLFALTLVVLVGFGGCQGGTSPHQIIGAVQNLTSGGALSDLRGAFDDMDEPEEIELGRAVTAGVGARYKLMRDPALTRYVALVGNAVGAVSDRPDLRYYFAVLDTSEVNAFAAPGGFVFITRGTLDMMNDEAALAGVLGHEIGHIALKHHGKTIKAEKRKALVVHGGQTALQFTSVSGFASMIGSAADKILDETVLKGFSQSEESESDKVGFQYAARAGYDPAGLREFLAALKTKGSSSEAVKVFFSTHPGIDDRLQEQTKLRDEYKGGGKREAERFAQAMALLKAQPAPQGQTPAQVQPPAQRQPAQPAPPVRQLQPRPPQRQQPQR